MKYNRRTEIKKTGLPLYLRILIPAFTMIFFTATAVYAQEVEEIQSGSSYPTVGLALSGGAALGFAHIGIIRVLEEYEIPVDFTAGTSMGSIAAALYSIGYSSDEMAKTVEEIDWIDLFSDKTPRDSWSYDKKLASISYLLELEFSRRGLKIPQGLSGGQNILNLFNLLTAEYSDVHDFDNLPVPFRSIAADLITGKEVVLSGGSLSEAMRASIAVPGLLTPFEIDGMILVDGGIVNNIPVDTLKAMGADIVIAVDVNKDFSEIDDYDNPFIIMNRSIRIMVEDKTEEQRRLADLLITPQLGDFNPGDFAKARELIAAGEKAARSSLPQLLEIKKRAEAGRPQKKSTPERVEKIIITEIRVKGAGGPETQYIRQMLELEKESSLERREIHYRVQSLYRTGRYESVRYTLLPAGGRSRILEIDLKEKSENMHAVRFGYGIESVIPGDRIDTINLYSSIVFRNMTGPGSSWTTNAVLLNTEELETSYFQPAGSLFFFSPGGFISKREQEIFSGSDLADRFIHRRAGLSFDAGMYLPNTGKISFGYEARNVNSYSILKDRSEFSDYRDNVQQLALKTSADTLDRYPFPRRGAIFSGDFSVKLPDPAAGSRRLLIETSRYFPFSEKGSLGIHSILGTDFDTGLELYELFILGEKNNFWGMQDSPSAGNHIAMAALELRHVMFRFNTALGGEDVYLIIRGNAGNTWTGPVDGNYDLIYGGGAGIGISTPLGALHFNISYSSRLNILGYISLGSVF